MTLDQVLERVAEIKHEADRLAALTPAERMRLGDAVLALERFRPAVDAFERAARAYALSLKSLAVIADAVAIIHGDIDRVLAARSPKERN